MPAILLSQPRKTKDFVDIRRRRPVADIYEAYLAIEAIANRPLEDDLHVAARPTAPDADRPTEGGDQ